MEAEILNYKEQVAAIDSALQADPSNEELLTIKTELLELISLTETLLQQEQSAAASAFPATSEVAAAVPAIAQQHSTPSNSVALSSFSSSSSSPTVPLSPQSSSTHGQDLSTQRTTPVSKKTSASDDSSNQPIYQPPQPTRNWTAGERCRALYSADGKYYEATILGVATGADGQNIYSVQYKGYETSPPATLTAQDLKILPDMKKYQKHHHQNQKTAGATSSSNVTESGTGSVEGDKRKRGAEGGATATTSGVDGGTTATKKKKGSGPSEQVQKQMAWQSFAKGGSKKGAKGSSSILKKSIFATPDNPEGKVGVVGSGKGMTQFQQRGKHVYGSATSSQ
ncbi:hypothetical protein BG004_008081 [Podila humilis]|nr:hypothetical protein BG004_008081 [Podila humilis]